LNAENPAKLRPTKSRQATSFVPVSKARFQQEDDDEEPSGNARKKGGVAFRNHDSVLEIEGDEIHVQTQQAPLRPSKGRVPTAYIQSTSTGGVTFADGQELEEVYLDEEVKLRPAKSRQATSFASRSTASTLEQESEEEEDSSGRRVIFRSHDTMIENDSGADPQAGVRSTKTRQATGWVAAPAPEDMQTTGRKGVVFRGHDSLVEVEAIDKQESTRPVKSRQATGFQRPKAEERPEDGPRRVAFTGQDSVVELESKQGYAPMRSTKQRQSTCFTPSGASGVRFGAGSSSPQEATSIEQVEVEAGARLKPVRKRQATAYVQPKSDFYDDEDSSEGGESQADGDDSATPTPSMRPSRSRIPTAFVRSQDSHRSSDSQVSFNPQVDVDPDGDTPEGMRPVRARLPTAFARKNDSEIMMDSDDEDLEEAEEKPSQQQSNTGSRPSPSTRSKPDSLDTEAHLVPDAPKDTTLITTTLKSLYFFRDTDEESCAAIIDAIQVFDFEDGENLTVQGNKKGTHFFIVEQGKLLVIRDGILRGEMGRGGAFGESVILMSGEQNATVQAKGPVRVYAVTGHTLRKRLRDQYHENNKEVSQLVNAILNDGFCMLLRKLSPYQTQCLYDQASVRHFACGEKLVVESEALDLIHVVVQGAVSLACPSGKLKQLGRGSVVGQFGLLYKEVEGTVTAEEPTQTLVLTQGLLNTMFGDSLEDVLMRATLVRKLGQHEAFAGLSADEFDVVASLSELHSLGPGKTLSEVCYFMVCLHGEVDVETPPPETEGATAEAGTPAPAPGGRRGSFALMQRLKGAESDSLGMEDLTHESKPWPLRARLALGGKPSAKIAVWRNVGLKKMLKMKSKEEDVELQDAAATPTRSKKSPSFRMAVWQDDKEAALKKVVVLRTLSPPQLRRLAEALEVQYAAVGEVIFSQGEEGKEFYIIHTGQLAVTIGEKQVRTLGMGDYVGERALLFSEPRSATITVTEDAELWKMSKESFMEVVQGPILDYMKDRIAFQNTKVNLDSLICLRIVGRGGFGVVKMVQLPDTGTRYALKCISKKQAVSQKQQKAIAVERGILAELDHPFVIKFIRSFNGRHYVYFLMELVTGGELLDALDHLGLLKRPQAQFYVASIALALEFLHERRIAYLDVKGENCLIDQHGYLKLIDFGIAERLQGGRIYGVKGTPLFMAPEVILGKGYTCSADLWSLGVCLYDFMVGRFPFADDSASNPEVFRAVLKAPLRLPKWLERDTATQDLISGLLTRSPSKRLGAGPAGYGALKDHSFFSDFCWDGLLSRQLEPPHKPNQETYAEDQESPESNDATVGTTPRMTVGLSEQAEGDDWQDPDPSWWEGF